MWEKIRKNLIKIYYNNKTRQVLPNSNNYFGIIQGLKMLEYLFEEEKKNFFPEDFIAGKDFVKEQNSVIGFSVRINAYVNILYGLENITVTSYEIFKKCIEKLNFKEISSNENNKKLLEDRKKEVKDFIFWRNKVFAHTAFSHPKFKGEQDNISTQLTSLNYFSGGCLCYGKKSFKIGGAAINAVGLEESKKFPIIDIAENHLKIMKHFENWENMFMEILEKLRRTGEAEIKKRNKSIEKLVFLPEIK